ncbi:MAG: hypothetical protein LQ346_006172 [Caloplaca aetnensis]|nr:MAG: hypothetical protein LQ346_006172 [Caloplaca aetnensis]
MDQPKSLKTSVVNLYYHDRATRQWIPLPRVGVYTQGNVASIQFTPDSISIIQEKEGNHCVLQLQKPNYTLIALHLRPRGKGSCISAEFACRTLPRVSLASKHGPDGLKKAKALPLSTHHDKMRHIVVRFARSPRNWEFVGTNRPPTSEALKRRIRRLCTSHSSSRIYKKRSRRIPRTPSAAYSVTSSETESSDPDTEPEDEQTDSDSSEDPVTTSPDIRRAEKSSTTQPSTTTALPARPQFTASKPKQQPAANSATKKAPHPPRKTGHRRIISFPTPPTTVPNTTSVRKRPLWEVDAELDGIEQEEEVFLANTRAAKLQLEREEEAFLARSRMWKRQLEGERKQASLGTMGKASSSRRELKSAFFVARSGMR